MHADAGAALLVLLVAGAAGPQAANAAPEGLFTIEHNLTVNKVGTGTVTSNDGFINCGVDCSESYAQGSVITLTATPAAGSTFTGWSGACSGTGVRCNDGASCTIDVIFSPVSQSR